MDFEPIVGKPVRFPPGRVAIRLDVSHRYAYQQLYARYQSYLAGLPVLRDRDFDGRRVLVTPAQLEALNEALSHRANGDLGSEDTVFGAQERGRTRLFKRLQYLS